MQEVNHTTYEQKMLEAFVDKEDKTLWYQHSFSRFNVNGVDSMKWNWSWWAFGGGFLYLLYRKQYLASLVLFFISMTIGMIPFMGFFLAILAGGFSPYFVYKGYKSKLRDIESNIEDEQTRIATMREVGGYHQWVVWVYAICATMIFFGFVSMFMLPSMMSFR